MFCFGLATGIAVTTVAVLLFWIRATLSTAL